MWERYWRLSVYQEPACDALLTFSIDGISKRKKGREPKFINREGQSQSQSQNQKKKKKKKNQMLVCLAFLLELDYEEYCRWRGSNKLIKNDIYALILFFFFGRSNLFFFCFCFLSEPIGREDQIDKTMGHIFINSFFFFSLLYSFFRGNLFFFKWLWLNRQTMGHIFITIFSLIFLYKKTQTTEPH